MSGAASGKVRVFLAGEGSNELGGYFGHRTWHRDDRPGVLQALLTRVQATGWEVGGARDWKSIRKFQARKAGHADTRNVLGVALDAKDVGCEVLAFSRDQDREPERRDAVEEGVRLVPEQIRDAPEVIGGVAVPKLEGWILALRGARGTEQLSPRRAEEDLERLGVAVKDGEAMVQVVEEADLEAIPQDAASLTTWFDRARAVLPRRVAACDARGQ